MSAITEPQSYFLVGKSRPSHLYEALREAVGGGYLPESTVDSMMSKALIAKSILIYFSPKWNSFVLEMHD